MPGRNFKLGLVKTSRTDPSYLSCCAGRIAVALCRDGECLHPALGWKSARGAGDGGCRNEEPETLKQPSSRPCRLREIADDGGSSRGPGNSTGSQAVIARWMFMIGHDARACCAPTPATISSTKKSSYFAEYRSAIYSEGDTGNSIPCGCIVLVPQI